MSFHWYLHHGPKQTVRDYMITETERIGPWFQRHWFSGKRFVVPNVFFGNAGETERKVMRSGQHTVDTPD